MSSIFHISPIFIFSDCFNARGLRRDYGRRHIFEFLPLCLPPLFPSCHLPFLPPSRFLFQRIFSRHRPRCDRPGNSLSVDPSLVANIRSHRRCGSFCLFSDATRERRKKKESLAAKMKNKYRCNPAISWDQHHRSELFALCTTLVSFSVTARTVFDNIKTFSIGFIHPQPHHLHFFHPSPSTAPPYLFPFNQAVSVSRVVFSKCFMADGASGTRNPSEGMSARGRCLEINDFSWFAGKMTRRY